MQSTSSNKNRSDYMDQQRLPARRPNDTKNNLIPVNTTKPDGKQGTHNQPSQTNRQARQSKARAQLDTRPTRPVRNKRGVTRFSQGSREVGSKGVARPSTGPHGQEKGKILPVRSLGGRRGLLGVELRPTPPWACGGRAWRGEAGGEARADHAQGEECFLVLGRQEQKKEKTNKQNEEKEEGDR
jgi:hypothetical protein